MQQGEADVNACLKGDNVQFPGAYRRKQCTRGGAFSVWLFRNLISANNKYKGYPRYT